MKKHIFPVIALIIIALGSICIATFLYMAYAEGHSAGHVLPKLRHIAPPPAPHSQVTKPSIDFECLANAIDRHENSRKFRYGCEYRGNDGKLHGYPESVARRKCIALCKEVYAKWGGKGNYFQLLNKTYAQDVYWYKDVEDKYTRRKQHEPAVTSEGNKYVLRSKPNASSWPADQAPRWSYSQDYLWLLPRPDLRTSEQLVDLATGYEKWETWPRGIWLPVS